MGFILLALVFWGVWSYESCNDALKESDRILRPSNK